MDHCRVALQALEQNDDLNKEIQPLFLEKGILVVLIALGQFLRPMSPTSSFTATL